MKMWASFVTSLLQTAHFRPSLVCSHRALQSLVAPTRDECAGAPSQPEGSLPAHHLTLFPTPTAGRFIFHIGLLVMYFDPQIFSRQFLSLQASQQFTGSTAQKLWIYSCIVINLTIS